METHIRCTMEPARANTFPCTFGSRVTALGITTGHVQGVEHSVVSTDKAHFHRTGQRQIGVLIEKMTDDRGATAPCSTGEYRQRARIHAAKLQVEARAGGAVSLGGNCVQITLAQ